MNTLASWPGRLARALLQEPVARRWAHVQGVAARARSLAPVLGADADLVEAAAWLHDIGYAPGLAVTGLHALDGARYLRDARHAGTLLCRLIPLMALAVLGLSGAPFHARRRAPFHGRHSVQRPGSRSAMPADVAGYGPPTRRHHSVRQHPARPPPGRARPAVPPRIAAPALTRDLGR